MHLSRHWASKYAWIVRFIYSWLIHDFFLSKLCIFVFPEFFSNELLEFEVYSSIHILFFEMIFLLLYAQFNHKRPCVKLLAADSAELSFYFFLFLFFFRFCVMNPCRLRPRMVTSLDFSVCRLAQQLSEEKWVLQFCSSMDSSW